MTAALVDDGCVDAHEIHAEPDDVRGALRRLRQVGFLGRLRGEQRQARDGNRPQGHH